MKKLSKKTGMQPGSLVYTGRKKSDKVKINLIRYDADTFSEKVVSDINQCYPVNDSSAVTWIDIKSLNDLKTIEMTGKLFNIHPLTLEDILNTEQRPKIDFFDQNVFIVLKMLAYNGRTDRIDAEQISLIVGKNYVITFQENEDDIFNGLREMIRKNKGAVRTSGADYLAYSLMDTIIDNYYIILEKLGQHIEDNEELLLNDPNAELLNVIYLLKRENLILSKSVWPLREVISKLDRGESPYFSATTKPFIRDLQDHAIIVIETVEAYMEMISNLIELYLSIGNKRLNEVMKILTIISTIFIPLTFVVGIYGMNFRYMPELEWKWGYFVVLGVMLLIFLAMILYFKRKKWL